MKSQIASYVALFSAVSACQIAKADVIANWTFETTVPTTVGPFSPEIGSGQASFGNIGSTASTISSPAGNGSAHSFSANGWDVNDYFQFSVSTVGFEGITISLDQMGSNTGPKNFEIDYSTDGLSFNSFSTYSVTNDSWSATGAPKSNSNHSFDLSSVTALDGQSTIYFRLIDVSTTAINSASPVATTGTGRIDNFIVNGVSSVPEPSSIALAAVGGIACLFAVRRKK